MAPPTDAGRPPPFAKAEGRFPVRPSLPLDQARYDWLRDVAHEARLPAAALMRALLSLAVESDELKARAIARARAQEDPSH